jgi:hypothetical protein
MHLFLHYYLACVGVVLTTGATDGWGAFRMTEAAAFDAAPRIGDAVLMARFLVVALPTGADTNCCTFAPTVTILGLFVVDLVEAATELLIEVVSEDVTFIG